MAWRTVTILTTTEASDQVSELLLEAGSGGTMIEDRNDVYALQKPEGHWDIIDEAIAERMGEDVRVSGWIDTEDEDALRAFLEERLALLRERFAPGDPGKLEIGIEPLETEDWSESWKRGYEPVRLGEHFVVCPSWLDAPPEPGEHRITIDPGMAFGTGTHETTGMCVELVEKYVRPGDHVIDIGTGSAILAIAAAHMGAGRVLATDLDADAVRVAAENVRENGFGEIVETRVGDLLQVVHEQARVVIANIITDVILSLAAPVRQVTCEGGVFIASGIVAGRLPEVRLALERAGWEMLDLLERGEWAALAARKR